MSQPYKITMKHESSGETIRIKGEIPGEAWTTLLRFRDESNKLREDLRECDNLNVNFSLQWDREHGLRSVVKNSINSRDLAVILHNLRPFILNDEPTAFNRTVNLLQRCISHDWMRRYFQSLKDLFSSKDFQNRTIISVGQASNNYRDLIVNSDKTLMTWLNAFEYHRDDDKRKLIEKIDKIMPEDLSRALFAGMIMDKVKAVLELGDVISFFESRNGSIIKMRFEFL